MQPNEKRFIKRSGTPEANVVREFSRVKRFKRRCVLKSKHSVVPIMDRDTVKMSNFDK